MTKQRCIVENCPFSSLSYNCPLSEHPWVLETAYWSRTNSGPETRGSSPSCHPRLVLGRGQEENPSQGKHFAALAPPSCRPLAEKSSLASPFLRSSVSTHPHPVGDPFLWIISESCSCVQLLSFLRFSLFLQFSLTQPLATTILLLPWLFFPGCSIGLTVYCSETSRVSYP